MGARSREDKACVAVFVAALAFNALAASVGWLHAPSDAYGWTQAESAIRVLFIRQGGPWLDYETPVLGPPFALPHELPVYHLLVAGLMTTTGLGLEPAGRVVALAFFYAALAALYALLAELGFARSHRLLMLAACLASPLYVFWSRTLTVESTALFFALTFLAFALRFIARGRRVDALGAVVGGAVAFAVKPPTMAAFVALAGLAWLVSQRRRGYRVNASMMLGALVLLVPVVVGWTWHGHTDGLKRLNPLAWVAYSTNAMVRDGMFGPAGLRSDADIWRVPWDRTVPETVGHKLVAVAALLGVALAARRRALFLVCLVVPLVHFAVFTPLHLSHGYDQYAVGLFLPLAAGVAVVALLERGGWRKLTAWTLMTLTIVSCIAAWRQQMLPLQRANAYRRPAWFVRLARTLAESTAPGDVIVGFGMNANPEVPYYARRRALMWPDWGDPSPDGEDVEVALSALEGHRIGALFTCPPGVPDETLARFRGHAGIDPSPRFELPSGGRGTCQVFLPARGEPAVAPPPEPSADDAPARR